MESKFKEIPERIKLFRTLKQRSVHECAKLLGIEKERYHQFEQGNIQLSLPEIELLAIYLEIPPRSLFDKSFEPSDDFLLLTDDKKPAFNQLRNKMIGAKLTSEREAKGISLERLSHETGIPVETLQSYENQGIAIPIDHLILISEQIGIPATTFLAAQTNIEDQLDDVQEQPKWQPEYPEGEPTENEEKDTGYNQFITAFKKIPPIDQAEIAKMLLQKLKASQ